jgi:ketosteroid isomerase-like protein
MKKKVFSIVKLLSIIVLFTGCQAQTATKSKHQELARAFLSVWNTGEVASLDSLLTDDFVRHGPATSVAGAEVSGIENMKTAVLQTREAVSDFDFQAEEILEMEGGVVMRCRLTGIFNLTGKPIDVKSIHILKIKEGKLAEHYSCLDHLELYLQAGMKVVTP